MLRIKNVFLVSLSFGGVMAVAMPSQAAWPERPVTIIVPFAPGGNTDLMARMIAGPLGDTLGQPFVVQNKPGAGGLIATEFVARAQPDGYTLFMGTTGQISLSPYTNKIRFDPIADFIPISTVGVNPFVIAVSNKLGLASLQHLVEYGKANPRKLNMGNAGVGGITHLSGVMFAHRAGIEVTEVSYKGAALALGDVIAGQIDMYSGNLSEVIPYAKDERVRLLGVSSSTRMPQLPNVPTIAETFPGHEVLAWNGLLAPAGTSQEIVRKIAGVVRETLSASSFRQKLEQAGITPLAESGEVFAARIHKEMETWKPLIERAGIKPQ